MKKSLHAIMLMATLASGYVYAENHTAITTAPAEEQMTTSTRKQIEKITEKSTLTEKNAKASRKNTTSSKSVAISNNATVILQLGAFTDPNLAYKQAAKASLLGVPAKVVYMKKRNGDMVRVVRSSTSLPQAEAEKVAADLREQQVNAILMSQ